MERNSDELDASAPSRSTNRAEETLPPPPSKGKEKLAAEPSTTSRPTPNEDEEEETCGICLADMSQSIPGELDGCRHRFCYVCLMEWAKIESRCPLCKQRFWSVRRPPVPGLLPSERIVPISERNQVYHPLGMESSAVDSLHLDPNCFVCHSSEKDAYLVMCELCNSTCHTYCVGLGVDIPEGEYCPDCTIAKSEYLKTQPDGESPFTDQETMEKIRKIRQGGSSISLSNFRTDHNEGGTMYSVLHADRRDTRSLSERHQREARVQLLRENWPRIQSGELQFSDLLRENTSATTNSEAATEQGCREADINKAWKMMDRARSAHVDTAPKNLTKSSFPVSKGGNSVCHKFWAPKLNLRETKGTGGSSSTHYSNPDAAPHNNGQYELSNKCAAQGRYNKQVQRSGPMSGEFHFQVKPESYWGSRTGSDDTVSRDLCKRRKIEMGQDQDKEVLAIPDKREGSKHEVQTLIKLSLKALDKDKKLGKNRYKEIARISTHTILAACGMEHSESVARPFSRVSCNHPGEIESSLLPGSCQKCFRTFLEEIVESVFMEKKIEPC
ncbi:hypothetical protein LUZ63_003541 [Rhynchospora breviuscula]|uniref:RING-type domain-containing protein n=1 Tax=Rhynchospora breviuscula TaxID=2022672 RepID=A0A9Q0D1Y7_9POAL|nr:hypothetical protein LUZ63_003541 [Rhynchospora breviuscula]